MSTSINEYYQSKAKSIPTLANSSPKSGQILFVQRFGSSLNLNIHFHLLAADGVYIRNNWGELKFHELPTITDQELENLLDKIFKRALKHLKKKGLIDSNLEESQNIQDQQDLLFNEHPDLLSDITDSMKNKGKKIGYGIGYANAPTLVKSKLCISKNNFSLHANTKVNALARERLYKLIEYCARPPISDDRLTVTDSGNIRVTLKTPWKNGTTAIELTPFEFIGRLAALIPQPNAHLVKYSGVFAPNHPWRSKIIRNPKIKKGFQNRCELKDDFEEKDKHRLTKDSAWAKLLNRTFKFDESCSPVRMSLTRFACLSQVLCRYRNQSRHP